MSSIANILAKGGNPASKTEKALRRIWEALDREEERQQGTINPIELNQLVIRLDDDEFEKLSQLAAKEGMTVKDWCLMALDAAAQQIAAGQHPEFKIARVAEDPHPYGSEKEKD
jgi:hypothetical protein